MWFQRPLKVWKHDRVNLYSVDELCLLGKDCGESAATRPHLQDDVAFLHTLGDDAGSVRVCKEVLAETFLEVSRFGSYQSER